MTSDYSNFLGMAKTAELGNNMEEALGYYNRALELEPTLVEAWLGKGRSAGWQSTMVNFRLPETIIAFEHAISNATDANKQAVKNEATMEVNRLVTTLYGICRNHLDEFGDLPNTWADYLSQVRQMLDALDHAEVWSPDDMPTLENIIHLCKDNIEGHVSRDEFNYGAETTHGLSAEYEQLLKEHLDSAVERMRLLNPTYSPPQVEKKVGSDCYVVTATMDDNFHPDVVTLRQFRDNILAQKPFGRKFINLYYRIGPRLAAFIKGRVVLRQISRILVVCPSAWLARFIIEKRH